MKRVGFLGGVGVAAILSLAGGAGFAGLSAMVSPAVALPWLIAAVAGAYIGFLLAKSPSRPGRLVALAAWLVATAAALAIAPHAGIVLVTQLLGIWLVRSLYFHTSVLAALADLLLNALAVGAGIWAAQQSGSVFMALWCFFLVQALFVYIPANFPRTAADNEQTPAVDAFSQAHRCAEEAVRRLVNQR